MMKLAMLKLHYTPEEAHHLLKLLDELRDTLWNNYREEIIDYCCQAENKESAASSFSNFDDDIIPF